jgi:hypothetical protein
MPPAMTATTTPEISFTSVTNPEQQTSPAAPPMDSSGFYRLQADALQFAPNEVHAPGYTLTRSSLASTALPKDGWDWFDSAEAAYAHHKLPLPQPSAPEPGDRIHRRRPPGAGPRDEGRPAVAES